MRYLNTILAIAIFILIAILITQATGVNQAFLNYFNREEKVIVSQKAAEIKIANNLSFQQYINQGDLLVKNGLLELAIANYARAAMLESSSAIPDLRIAEAYYQHNEFSQTIQNALHALNNHPDSTQAKIMMAKAYLASNNLAEAQKIMLNVLDPDAEGSYYKGLLAAIGNDRETAGKFLHRTVQIGEADATEQNKDWQTKANRLINAYREYDKYRDSPNPHFRALLAQALSENNQHQLALAEIKKLVADYPEYRDAWIIRGLAEIALRDFASAIQSLNTVIGLDQTLPEPYYYLSLAYLAMNDADTALQKLDTAESLGWQDEMTLSEKRAQAYMLKQDWRKASAEYEKILAKQTNFSPAFLVKPLWLFWEKLKEPEKALEPTKELAEKNPDNPLALALRGRAMLENGHEAEAKTYLLRALELDEKLPETNLYLGDWYAQAKHDAENAKKYYELAYKLGMNGDIGIIAAEKLKAIIK
ncbi:MAG: tetratricopeptide repeat protein [Patescibacteria group bacterium]|nr:tetratricopeptide repeat protein [Patescibacteria group bacterium]